MEEGEEEEEEAVEVEAKGRSSRSSILEQSSLRPYLTEWREVLSVKRGFCVRGRDGWTAVSQGSKNCQTPDFQFLPVHQMIVKIMRGSIFGVLFGHLFVRHD